MTSSEESDHLNRDKARWEEQTLEAGDQPSARAQADV